MRGKRERAPIVRLLLQLAQPAAAKCAVGACLYKGRAGARNVTTGAECRRSFKAVNEAQHISREDVGDGEAPDNVCEDLDSCADSS
jgi:hypothetical protein